MTEKAFSSELAPQLKEGPDELLPLELPELLLDPLPLEAEPVMHFCLNPHVNIYRHEIVD